MIKEAEEFFSIYQLFNLLSLSFQSFFLYDFGFGPNCLNLRSVVEEVTLKPVTSQVIFQISPSNYCLTMAPYSSVTVSSPEVYSSTDQHNLNTVLKVASAFTFDLTSASSKEGNSLYRREKCN